MAPSKPSLISRFFASSYGVYLAAAVLRAVLLAYGLWQDAHSPVKYTDIDYLVFTDAARFVSRGQSPYARETYRYTPLLAWLLLPTARATAAPAPPPAAAAALLALGKALFALADVAAGHLLARVLTLPAAEGGRGLPPARARAFAAVWLLNPMVAAISTRGSSEGLVGALAAALVWAALRRRLALAAVLLGLAVHVKIYPFVYAPALLWWMDDARLAGRGPRPQEARLSLRAFVTPARVRLAVLSLAVFLGLNAVMASLYGADFVRHTFLHHVSRLDHRHNFSPYNTQLYQASAAPPARLRLPGVESFAFVPQLLLSTLLIPLVAAKKDLAASMLAQTFAFVTFNKVCTSQYFLWYMVFLPLYLPRSTFLRHKRVGIAALVLWVGTQALWLQQGFQLEFLGKSTFVPGLWLSSLAFFLVNCWILGVIIGDIAVPPPP